MTDLPMPPAKSYELAWGGRRGGATLERRYQRDGSELWGIYEDSNTCMIGPGLWAFERMPSSRTDEDLARSRFTLDGALDLWRRHLVVALSGATWRDCVAHDLPVRGCDRLYDPWRLVELIGVQEGRPKLGSWISQASIEAGKTSEGSQDPREISLSLDQDLRRAVALFADGCFREGTVSAVVASEEGFVADMSPYLDDGLGGGQAKLIGCLLQDLLALLREGTAFPIGLATLEYRAGAVIAAVLDRRAGIDF